MKNINKKTKVKFGFLLFIGLLVVVVLASELKSTEDEQVPEDKEDVAEDLEVDSGYIDEDKLKEIEENYGEQGGSTEDEAKESEDYSGRYLEKYGKDKMELIENNASGITSLYFEEEVNWDKWKAHVSKPIFEEILTHLGNIPSDMVGKKELNLSRVHSIANTNDGEVKVEVEARWFANGVSGLSGEQIDLIYITYDMTGKEPLVKEVVFV